MTPTLYVVAGGAGAGKTTLGTALAQAGGPTLLDQDSLTNPLLAQIANLAGVPGDLDDEALRGPVRRARYQCLLDAALDNIAIGRSVVVVAPFTAELSDPHAWAAAFAPFAPAAVTLVWVDVPAAVARERRRRRGLPRDLTARLERRVEDQVDAAGAPATRPAVPHIAVDGTAATSLAVARILRQGAEVASRGPEQR